LFFVLSGFLITSILYEAKQSKGYFKNFYMRRVLRIFPLYYGVLIVAFVAVPLLWPNQGWVYRNVQQHQVYLWLYLQNFVLIHWKWFTHFWSLAVEEQFYLVWPAVVFLFARRALMGVCGGMVVVALVIRVVMTWRGADIHATYYFTPARMDALAVGALLALAAHGRGGVAALAGRARVVGLISAVCLLAILVLSRGSFRYGLPLVRTAGFSLLAFFFGSLLVWAILTHPKTPWGRFCNNGVLRFFGKYSYGLYVFHGLLLPWLPLLIPIDWLAQRLHSYHLAVAVYYVGATAVSTACALVSWHLYEKHFLKLKRFFEYRAATLRQPVRDTLAPPPLDLIGNGQMPPAVRQPV
jgi:peptidoglycan/LPS O-acetylase OafA/YrhL